ncbi:MAG: DDE-type integrase/transposase/recombinase, partial [Proteobacteria bacterium]|nr:DDE-type integrase/transposase/recombinase [Pseudomonadota bacterium]
MPIGLPLQIERTILPIKKAHPNWGEPKIREKLLRQYDMDKPPAKNTVHAVLERHGLVKRRRKKRYKARGTSLRDVHAPNALWCTDYKGEFRLGDRKYCYPLTISDYATRYLLICDGQESTRMDLAYSVFERAFEEYGIPQAIRTDNGIPFASPNAFFGMSKLSVWWLRLGINIERSAPGLSRINHVFLPISKYLFQ